ncbi:glycolate oxidase subunit GlcE [Herbaspirillum huttiense]|uniref:glycolate oxidase subunit GlcE n=1 Tax=Herbaspirillum huttiense TaxID=863372 RepID=UPI0010667E48|nr:glycolate oxidase subunit GlcE [Herbaspirillum huttiense]QBP77698.1 glycolate oxidase subunit GlcE [Herbaspirillum huttiense]
MSEDYSSNNVHALRADDPFDGTSFIARLHERIRNTVRLGGQLRIEGKGTRSDAHCPTSGEPLSLRDWQGIVQYEPDDQVITVRTGTPVVEVQRVLALQRQMLGFEPPQQAGSTIGGAVALGWSGPRRPFAGALRDHLLGVRMLDGLGRDLRFGGQVVKNVAGFDVARLMAGSLGLLGPLLEVSLRVIPCPAVEITTVLALDAVDSLALMQRLPTGPGLLSGAVHVDGCLYLRSAGSPECVEAFLRRHGGTLLEQQSSEAFWRGFAHQTHPFFVPLESDHGHPMRLWRVSVRPGSPVMDIAPATSIDWAGAVRWVWAPMSAYPALKQWATAHGGHVALWRHGTRQEQETVLQASMTPALRDIHRRIKQVFDPHGIFHPGRLFASC